MRSMKYAEGWTRRHFLEQVAKGVFAAGVLLPLMGVIGRNGGCEAAYPPELISIEAYTKGELKPGAGTGSPTRLLVRSRLLAH